MHQVDVKSCDRRNTEGLLDEAVSMHNDTKEASTDLFFIYMVPTQFSWGLASIQVFTFFREDQHYKWRPVFLESVDTTMD